MFRERQLSFTFVIPQSWILPLGIIALPTALFHVMPCINVEQEPFLQMCSFICCEGHMLLTKRRL